MICSSVSGPVSTTRACGGHNASRSSGMIEPAYRQTGQRLLQRCPVCLYAGSIMPEDLLALCPPQARVVDTGPLTLEQIITELADADAAGHDVARLHSGDPSLY